MNEQNNKLEVIRNRCRISALVARILRIILEIGMIGSLVGAIACFFQRARIDQFVPAEIAAGTLREETLKLGGPILKVVIDYNKAFQEGNYAGPIIISCLTAAAICAVWVILLTLFRKIFIDLATHETPFSDTVMRRLKMSFIIMAVLLVLFIGLGVGVIGGLLLWCIYSVLDYGKALQTEVDETL